jgi:hypothetical protein
VIANQKYLKFGNEEEIEKAMSPAKAQRRQVKTVWHFDRKEKPFLDPSQSLGITALAPSLCALAPWRDKFS